MKSRMIHWGRLRGLQYFPHYSRRTGLPPTCTQSSRLWSGTPLPDSSRGALRSPAGFRGQDAPPSSCRWTSASPPATSFRSYRCRVCGMGRPCCLTMRNGSRCCGRLPPCWHPLRDKYTRLLSQTQIRISIRPRRWRGGPGRMGSSGCWRRRSASPPQARWRLRVSPLPFRTTGRLVARPLVPADLHPWARRQSRFLLGSNSLLIWILALPSNCLLVRRRLTQSPIGLRSRAVPPPPFRRFRRRRRFSMA
mmetsp:Transcript_674/g.1868  ORF Transcript_674/g.1868 Transcript_674/m.1868 type:complete len:250 (-) Transcript_674:763-1512(-)